LFGKDGSVSAFDIVRERVSIEEVIGARAGEQAHCVAPEHPDNDPSMHNYGDHVHCFACGFHGDVTDVHAAKKGIAHPIEAALDLAGEYGIELPKQDPEVQRRAQKRREKEDRYQKQAKACHKALSRYEDIVNWWEGRGFGAELRKRFLLGANRYGTAAVIPFWHRGRVQGLIWRKVDGEPKYLYPKAEDFPGGCRPLFIPGPVRVGAFLVEGIIDALALAASGESAVTIGGTGISRERLRELERLPGPLYILPDADKEGATAAREWIRRLYPKALLCPAEYGGEASHA